MELTKNRAVLDWIDQQVKLTQPDQVIWIDGSEQQLEALRKEACATGELHELNQEKLPGCYLHRSDPSDVAGWRAGPSSAVRNRRMPVPPTTGWTRRRCMPSCIACTMVL